MRPRPAKAIIAAVRYLAIAAVLVAFPAAAERHVMERGETLEHVARAYGCRVEAVLRANRRNNTLVPPGTVVTVPACRAARTAKAPPAQAITDDDDRARRALATIDGAAFVKPSATPRHVEIPELRSPVVVEPKRGTSASIGQPWNGRLQNGTPLVERDGYRVRRPNLAFGADHVVEQLQSAIAEVRRRFPDVHTLAIGDLSSKHGGPLDRHRSHQSGLDVDVGLYFYEVPPGYPDSFVAANDELDLEATWALIKAFARTAGAPGGLQVIFLDHAVQGRLYRWARDRGTPADQLARLLQYPRGKDELIGIVRHWPSHTDHLHVRFNP